MTGGRLDIPFLVYLRDYWNISCIFYNLFEICKTPFFAGIIYCLKSHSFMNFMSYSEGVFHGKIKYTINNQVYMYRGLLY